MRTGTKESEIRQISLEAEMLEEIPAMPAKYAIYSLNETDGSLIIRYSGLTANLRTSIKEHFKPSEPIVDLRYFMLSAKKKVLRYKLNTDPEEMQPPKREVYAHE